MAKMPAVQVMVRISGALKDRVEKAARANQNSMSGEISDRLKRTFWEDAKRRVSPELKRVTQRLSEALVHGGELGADARKVDRAAWLSDPIAFDVALLRR